MACASEQNVAHQYTGFIFSSEDAILKNPSLWRKDYKNTRERNGQNIVQDKTIFLWLYAILFSDTVPLTGECVTKWGMMLFWEHDHGFGSKIRAHNMAKNTEHFHSVGNYEKSTFCKKKNSELCLIEQCLFPKEFILILICSEQLWFLKHQNYPYFKCAKKNTNTVLAL